MQDEVRYKEVERLFYESQRIEEKIAQLIDVIERLNEKHDFHLMDHMALKGIFESQINNNLVASNSIMKKVQAKIKNFSGAKRKYVSEVNKMNMFDESGCLIQIGGEDNNLGTILSVNNNCYNVTGFQKEEVLKKNIIIVMPQIFGRTHQEMLIYNTGRDKTDSVVDKQVNVFGLHKLGYAYPLILYVGLYPKINQGLQYLGYIRAQEDEFSYILT